MYPACLILERMSYDAQHAPMRLSFEDYCPQEVPAVLEALKEAYIALKAAKYYGSKGELEGGMSVSYLIDEAIKKVEKIEYK